jgi:hypothetical protein
MEFATIILTDEHGHTAGILLVDVTGPAPAVTRQVWQSFVYPTHAYLCDGSTGAEADDPFSVAAPADVRSSEAAINAHLAKLYPALP